MSGQESASRVRAVPAFYIRMIVFAGAILAMLAAVAMVAHRTWVRAAATRGEVRQVHQVGVWLGHRIREAVHGLDSRMLRFKLGMGPGERAEFQRELSDFRRWLDEQKSYLDSADERTLLAVFERELDRYRAAARLLAQPGDENGRNREIAIEVAELSRHSKALIELGFELSAAHQATADDVLADAGRENEENQWTTFVALGTILCIGCGMGWMVYRDSITPLRRELQESRQQLVRQEKLAALGEMTAVVAHEIRNPLTAIKARLYTLRKLMTESEAAREDTQVIADEIDRLDRIVREFLLFARPPEPKVSRIDPMVLLRRVRDLVMPAWRDSGVQFAVEDASCPSIEADTDQITQALLNLVQNAAQAIVDSGKSGTVRLRAFAVPAAQGERAKDVLRIEVADDGPGIPSAVQARLFDPFFTTKSRGTGLGLVFTLRTAEKHGGTITFHTAPGRGTTFALLLPFRSP